MQLQYSTNDNFPNYLQLALWISDHISVWVEWDCGHKNVYTFSPLFGRDLVLVDEPRVLFDEIIAVGCLVERGDILTIFLIWQF